MHELNVTNLFSNTFFTVVVELWQRTELYTFALSRSERVFVVLRFKWMFADDPVFHMKHTNWHIAFIQIVHFHNKVHRKDTASLGGF